MKKKVLAIVMALALVISVCACKKDDSSETRSKRGNKTEDKDRDDDDDDDDDKDDDDDDDDDDDTDETTKKTKKTKATTEETEEPDDTEETTKKTKKETTEETEEPDETEDTEDTEETDETTTKGTTASTSIDMGDFFNYDPSNLNNKAAAEWAQDLINSGAIVMDMEEASSMAGNTSSFPTGTKGFTAIDTSYTKTYVYLEIAMGADYTEDQLKQIGEAMKQQGYDVETSGDCMILTSTAQNAFGVIDLKTGYYFFAVGITAMPDAKEETKLAKQLGFNL